MRFRSLALHNLPFIMLGLFVFSAAQVPAQVSDEATLVGMVSVSNGDFPPRRIQINLETRGALIGITFCDNEGRFSFPNLRSDLYHVVVNDSDYVSVDESVSLHAGQMNLVQVRLVPKGEGAIAPKPSGMSYCRESTRTPSMITIGEPGPIKVVGPRSITSAPSLTKPPERNTRNPGRRACSSSESVGAVDSAISAESITLSAAPHACAGTRTSGATGMERDESV